MKKLLTTVLLVVAMVLPQQVMGRDYNNETLNYEIVYHWGMIWKHAADATLNIHKTSNGYKAQLTGKTRSWADKVYPVRDTLKCTLNSDLKPWYMRSSPMKRTIMPVTWSSFPITIATPMPIARATAKAALRPST